MGFRRIQFLVGMGCLLALVPAHAQVAVPPAAPVAPRPIPMMTPNLATSAAANQTAMGQILSQLHRGQFQLSVAAAETAPVFANRPVVFQGPVRSGQ